MVNNVTIDCNVHGKLDRDTLALWLVHSRENHS